MDHPAYEPGPHRAPGEPPPGEPPPGEPPQPPPPPPPPVPPEPPEPVEPPRAPAPAPCDPVAVAAGNASLLGIGYLLLGHRRLAAIAVLGTVVLLDLVATRAAAWSELLLLLWWAAGAAHGWFLARRREHVLRRGQRNGTLALAVAVLLAAVLLRVDAHGIENRVREARDSGDCDRVMAVQDEVGSGHRLAGATVVKGGDAVAEVCLRLERAASALAAAGRDGDLEELERGFGVLARALKEPGHEKTVQTVLDTFLDGLPTERPCDTADIADWLRDREPTRDVLDRSAEAAARAEPAALLGCGEELMDDDNWQQARTRYQRLVDEYPDGPLAGEARSGAEKARVRIELDDVRRLVAATHDASSGYCDAPAKYSEAPAHRKGTNRALFLGDTEYTGKLPGDWRTDDPAEAALVVCAGAAENGAAVDTCYYENDTSAHLPHQVTFHKVKIPLKVYELRTGKRIDPRSVQIGGGSCPAVLHYEYYGTYDYGPGDQLVSTAKSDVRDAFRPVVTR
ncbi:tetratricopeptide repeat protein [Streptomyces lycii]|uniref:Uncharacterized protein n=1 Tax=Streptomyces lycii TaxID=2654337 RepID=A0ABQ7FRW2_9ACTN|nr:hypothetical protein [Streptomyces lycii]KAF4410258.1 hypothetical protein GCU69_04765 [Streptomyces lycii]